MNETQKLIVFSLDEQYYGLPLHFIIKVLRAVEITEVPNASKFILGVINIHGEVAPVIDLRKMIGLNQKAIRLSDHFIMMQVSSRAIIIIVESILTVTEFLTHEITPVDSCLTQQIEQVQGILKKDNKLILILNIEKLLSYNDMQMIEHLPMDWSKTT